LLAGIKVFIDAEPNLFRSAAQAAVFAWPALGIFAVVGIIGLALAHRIGLPGMWANGAPIVAPLAIGAALAIIPLAVDHAPVGRAIPAAKMKLPSLHIFFPASAIIYPGGAIIVGIIYLLVPIPLVTWLVSSLLLRGGGRETTLWIASALAAAV